MDSCPLVSIGMPVYNGARFIRESFESLLSEDYEHFELIVCDNASTDGTEAICREYAGRDNRIDYRRSAQNVGAVANFQKAADLACGKYFMWASDHDLWHRSYVSKLLAVLEAEPDVSLAYARTELIDEEGAALELMEDRVDTRGMSPYARYTYLIRHLSRCNMFYGLIRLDALRRTRPLSDAWSPDRLTLVELNFEGPIAQIPETLFHRRRNRPPETEPERRERVLVAADPVTGKRRSQKSTRTLYRELRNQHIKRVWDSRLNAWEKIRALAVTYRCFWRSAARGVPVFDEAGEEWRWRIDLARLGNPLALVKFPVWLARRAVTPQEEDY